MRHRLWDNTTLVARQLPNVGQVTATKLRAAGVTDLWDLATRDPRWVEQAVARHYPFGSQLQQTLLRLLPPRIDLQLRVLRMCWVEAAQSCRVFVVVRVTMQAIGNTRHMYPFTLPTGTIGGGRAEIQVQVQRIKDASPGDNDDNVDDDAAAAPHQASTSCPPSRTTATYATLVVGTTHDDALLLALPLVLERIPTPLKKTVMAEGIVQGGNQPCRVVASVILDRWAGNAGDLCAPSVCFAYVCGRPLLCSYRIVGMDTVASINLSNTVGTAAAQPAPISNTAAKLPVPTVPAPSSQCDKENCPPQGTVTSDTVTEATPQQSSTSPHVAKAQPPKTQPKPRKVQRRTLQLPAKPTTKSVAKASNQVIATSQVGDQQPAAKAPVTTAQHHVTPRNPTPLHEAMDESQPDDYAMHITTAAAAASDGGKLLPPAQTTADTRPSAPGHAVVDNAAAGIMQRWRAGAHATIAAGSHVATHGNAGTSATTHNAWVRQPPRLVITPMSTSNAQKATTVDAQSLLHRLSHPTGPPERKRRKLLTCVTPHVYALGTHPEAPLGDVLSTHKNDTRSPAAAHSAADEHANIMGSLFSFLSES